MRLPRLVRRPLGRARRLVRDVVGPDPDLRRRLGRRYLHGSGIEIGALAARFPVAPGATVRYVDRLTVEEMREHYPELAGLELIPPDIVDDGETLASIPPGSLDFVVASHVIEHCENPIGTIAAHLSRLREGGVLLLAVPDKRHTFDEGRPATPLAHLERDHAEGPAWSRRGHYEEWIRAGGTTDGVDEKAEELDRSGYSIHFHVWTPATFLELLAYCRDGAGLPFELELFQRGGPEFFVLLTKLTPPQA